jgi:hypothetical protein
MSKQKKKTKPSEPVTPPANAADDDYFGDGIEVSEISVAPETCAIAEIITESEPEPVEAVPDLRQPGKLVDGYHVPDSWTLESWWERQISFAIMARQDLYRHFTLARLLRPIPEKLVSTLKTQLQAAHQLEQELVAEARDKAPNFILNVGHMPKLEL